jgi:DegV family protein with EDD domain
MPVTPDGVLMTDSCADLPARLTDELGLEVLRFPYVLDGVEHIDDSGASLSHAAFYAAMRAGSRPTTAQIPRQVFVDAFRSHAAAGEPVLYLGFSSALSGTFDVAWSARAEVLAEYPEAEIRLVDTLAASAAQGLLVYEAARRWRDGMTPEALEAWVAAERPRLNGWFTIDDLETLRRGGRLSNAAAVAGTLLEVKPILHLTRDGRLEVKRSVRGRSKSMRALVDTVAERGDGLAGQTIAGAHGDAAGDAAALAQAIRERTNVGDVLTLEVGPVIGAHTGPGMLAVVFWGQPV